MEDTNEYQIYKEMYEHAAVLLKKAGIDITEYEDIAHVVITDTPPGDMELIYTTILSKAIMLKKDGGPKDKVILDSYMKLFRKCMSAYHENETSFSKQG